MNKCRDHRYLGLNSKSPSYGLGHVRQTAVSLFVTEFLIHRIYVANRAFYARTELSTLKAFLLHLYESCTIVYSFQMRKLNLNQGSNTPEAELLTITLDYCND